MSVSCLAARRHRALSDALFRIAANPYQRRLGTSGTRDIITFDVLSKNLIDRYFSYDLAFSGSLYLAASR